MDLPGGGAVPIENVEVLARKQLAPVYTGLDGSQSSQDTYLFHIADQWHYVQSLQLGVHGVQTANKMLEEQLECLRKTQHRVAGDNERGDLLTAIVNQLALVGCGVRT